jgi:predicted MPP superfamily phosphohydrolase
MRSFGEDFRVLVFIGIIAAVYVLAAGIIIRSLIRRLRQDVRPAAPVKIWFRRTILTLAGIGIVCFAYGYLVEPYWLSVTHIKIGNVKLKKGTQPVRLVHFSDLHCDPKPRLEAKLVRAIADARPDLIVFTGDCINSVAGLPVFRDCLTRIAKIAPTFVVKGNWDTRSWVGIDLFQGTGATELDGFAVMLEVRGFPIWVSGVAVDNEEALKQALGSIPPEAFKLFLYHYPDLIQEVAALNVDLYCAGHTHGGQIALPFYGALMTLSKYGKKYEGGLYREKNTWLYVNRGIGMEGGRAPRVRFCARPELTVIEISPP